MFKRILSWFKPAKKEKPTVELILNEVATPGCRTSWQVEVMVNGSVRTTHHFKRKPTKTKLLAIMENHQ